MKNEEQIVILPNYDATIRQQIEQHGTLGARWAAAQQMLAEHHTARQKLNDEANALEPAAKGGDKRSQQRYNALVDQINQSSRISFILQAELSRLILEQRDQRQMERLNAAPIMQ